MSFVWSWTPSAVEHIAIPYEWVNISTGSTQMVIVTERVLP
jgi:hypothetical protein